jgi:predicted 3-demethylubiquinone-9 3-methyltransferase (glyoxalase superfamily)
MWTRLILSLMFLFAWSGASVAQEVPVLVGGDLAGATITSTEYYAGQALFGYIDGGAELYLEYGFKKLGRQEVEIAKERIVVENYQMSGANEAFGVFSVQRFKCVPVDSLSPHTCLSKYQLQAVIGNCYVSIVNETGSSRARKASLEIYQALRSKIRPLDVVLSPAFRSPLLASHLRDLVIACGPLGVQNGLSEWDALFQGISRFGLTVLPLEAGDQRLALAHLRFAAVSDCSEFCRLAGFAEVPVDSVRRMETGGTVRIVRRLNDEELYFGESTTAFPGKEALLQLLRNPTQNSRLTGRQAKPQTQNSKLQTANSKPQTPNDQGISTSVATFLMFTGKAEEAMNFYVSLFDDAKVHSVTRYGPNEAGPEGSVMVATFALNGQEFMCIDSPGSHAFTFTPSMSIYINCSSAGEVERLFRRLSENGQILMPLDAYPFSDKFGWVADKYGVSWQINLKNR